MPTPKKFKYPRGKCPDCGYGFALHDGKIWNHIIGQEQCPGAGKRVVPTPIEMELRRCVELLDGECMRQDGSNADTTNAHALLGDFNELKI